jgi:hypothetical protein
MKHQASKIKVYQTTDYKLFRFLEGNRETNKKKQDRIIGEMKKGNDILDESPILVFENGDHLDIEDGQNRFQIAKSLGRPVHYIIRDKKLSLYNLAKNNSNVEKWTGKDFINCYSKAGNENYRQLAKFYKTYGIAIGSCLVLLTNGTQKADSGSAKYDSLNEQFQQGTFVVKKYKDAVQFAEICKSFSAFSGWNSRAFIVAMGRILQADLVDIDVLLKKFNRDPRKLVPQSNWKGYVNNLQLIYNIDNSKQKPIY